MLKFDGVNYAFAPRLLALPNISSLADGNDTLLILNRLGGDLRTTATSLGEISGALYYDTGREFGFSISSTKRQFVSRLSNDFPRTITRYGDVIRAGRSGWMRLWLVDDAAILGAVINYNPGGGASAFNNGLSLRRLNFTPSAILTIPVFPPAC